MVRETLLQGRPGSCCAWLNIYSFPHTDFSCCHFYILHTGSQVYRTVSGSGAASLCYHVGCFFSFVYFHLHILFLPRALVLLKQFPERYSSPGSVSPTQAAPSLSSPPISHSLEYICYLWFIFLLYLEPSFNIPSIVYPSDIPIHSLCPSTFSPSLSSISLLPDSLTLSLSPTPSHRIYQSSLSVSPLSLSSTSLIFSHPLFLSSHRILPITLTHSLAPPLTQPTHIINIASEVNIALTHPHHEQLVS